MGTRHGEWFRSMLFVPGHKLDWIMKSPQYGADALVLDLEDAVPESEKVRGRHAVRTALERFSVDGTQACFVRVNGWGTQNIIADLLQVVRPGLAGVMLPKTDGPRAVASLDDVLTELEAEQKMPLGSIEIFPAPESASGLYRMFEICQASKRVRRSVGAIIPPGGDVARALNVTVRPRSHIEDSFNAISILGARSAGIGEFIAGPTLEVADLELVRHNAQWARDFGATGGLAIHPSHIPVLNEVFGPSAEQVEYARALLESFHEARVRGDGAVSFRGEMIDYAHAQTQAELLIRAKAVGGSARTIAEELLKARRGPNEGIRD